MQKMVIGKIASVLDLRDGPGPSSSMQKTRVESELREPRDRRICLQNQQLPYQFTFDDNN